MLVFFLWASAGCGRGSPPAFSGAQAYQILSEYCALGPRVPGTEAHRKAADYIAGHFQNPPFQLRRQVFVYHDSLKKDSLTLTNFLAAFHPERKKRILFCTHWDSRPYADQEKDSSLHHLPILGANDGGSGTAVLLELAGLVAKKDPQIGVDLIFFDGEDYGPEGVIDQYFLGSKYFAKHAGGYYCELGILLDMVGDSDLTIFQEQYSTVFASDVVRKVFDRAQKLKLPGFVPQVRHAVLDDHLPLLEIGLPVIDLIDFDYPAWHTLADRPEACSPRSLEQVGKLLVSLAYQPD